MREEVVGDRLLLNDAAAGGMESFGTLYDRHVAAVYRFACSHGLGTPDAKDVTQEVFVVAFEKARSIQLADGGSLLPWLLVTCRNMCLAHRRSAARTRAVESFEETADAAADPGVVMEGRELAESLRTALGELGTVDRRIVELCLEEGRSYAEAAEELGVSHGAVRNRLSRTRDRLRSLLGPQGKEAL